MRTLIGSRIMSDLTLGIDVSDVIARLAVLDKNGRRPRKNLLAQRPQLVADLEREARRQIKKKQKK